MSLLFMEQLLLIYGYLGIVSQTLILLLTSVNHWLIVFFFIANVQYCFLLAYPLNVYYYYTYFNNYYVTVYY